jgi:hypothetical protein
MDTLIASHHFNTPTGPWFDLLRPHLTLVPARVPTKIFGNELRHFAHRSDVSAEHGLRSTFLMSFLGHIGKNRNANLWRICNLRLSAWVQIIRLEALLHMGGIYLDIDTYV